MNDDQPYPIRTDKGPLVSVPYSNEINDFTLLTRRNLTTDAFRDTLIEELSVLLKEGEKTARLMNVGLRQFLEYAKSLDNVWWPTREELAQWYLMNSKGHMPGVRGANGGILDRNLGIDLVPRYCL